jgi:hypothetical protein
MSFRILNSYSRNVFQHLTVLKKFLSLYSMLNFRSDSMEIHKERKAF